MPTELSLYVHVLLREMSSAVINCDKIYENPPHYILL